MAEDLQKRAEDSEERKKKEEEAKKKKERYEQYKSASRKAKNETVESWVEYITKKEALRRILFPPINYIQSGVQGGWNWLKDNTALGLLLQGTGSDYVSDGLFNAQSRDIVDLRLKNSDKYIEDHTSITPEHKYAIEKNRLDALNTTLKANPDNINLQKEALKIEKNHLDLMKEFTKTKYDEQTREFNSKSHGDPSLIKQMKELEESYNKHLEIVGKADPNFVARLKKEYNRYTNEELDYKVFLPHFAGGIGTHPQDEAKKLITRLGSSGMELIETIDMDAIPEGDFKRKVENLKKNGLGDLDKFSNAKANLLLGLCDSEVYARLMANAFKEQIKGTSDKEKNMFLSNPHFGGFKVGGIEGFSADAVRQYLGNSPHINDYKKVQNSPDFIKDAYSLRGFCSNKKGFVTNPSTIFLYGDPTNNSKDIKNTINHEAAHSVLHALQKNNYMAKDVSKVERAFETEIKHKLNQEFPDFSMKEGTKVGGIKINSSEREKELNSELEGIVGKGKIYPRLNKTLNHLKAMGGETPSPDLIKTIDGMVYGGDSLINNDGRKVPNNLNNIKDEDVRFMVAVSYFNPKETLDDKTTEQFQSVKEKMNTFNKKNENITDAHLDVFVAPVVSSGYNKNQHNEEKLVRFIADEKNVSNLMTQFSHDASVTPDEKKVIQEGINSSFKVQKEYEKLQDDAYNISENPNPFSAIWNRQIKSSDAHSHEQKGDGGVMNHDSILPSKPRIDLANDALPSKEAERKVDTEKLQQPKKQEFINR